MPRTRGSGRRGRGGRYETKYPNKLFREELFPAKYAKGKSKNSRSEKRRQKNILDKINMVAGTADYPLDPQTLQNKNNRLDLATLLHIGAPPGKKLKRHVQHRLTEGKAAAMYLYFSAEENPRDPLYLTPNQREIISRHEARILRNMITSTIRNWLTVNEGSPEYLTAQRARGFGNGNELYEILGAKVKKYFDKRTYDTSRSTFYIRVLLNAVGRTIFETRVLHAFCSKVYLYATSNPKNQEGLYFLTGYKDLVRAMDPHPGDYIDLIDDNYPPRPDDPQEFDPNLPAGDLILPHHLQETTDSTADRKRNIELLIQDMKDEKDRKAGKKPLKKKKVIEIEEPEEPPKEKGRKTPVNKRIKYFNNKTGIITDVPPDEKEADDWVELTAAEAAFLQQEPPDDQPPDDQPPDDQPYDEEPPPPPVPPPPPPVPPPPPPPEIPPSVASLLQDVKDSDLDEMPDEKDLGREQEFKEYERKLEEDDKRKAEAFKTNTGRITIARTGPVEQVIDVVQGIACSGTDHKTDAFGRLKAIQDIFGCREKSQVYKKGKTHPAVFDIKKGNIKDRLGEVNKVIQKTNSAITGLDTPIPYFQTPGQAYNPVEHPGIGPDYERKTHKRKKKAAKIGPRKKYHYIKKR